MLEALAKHVSSTAYQTYKLVERVLEYSEEIKELVGLVIVAFREERMDPADNKEKSSKKVQFFPTEIFLSIIRAH